MAGFYQAFDVIRSSLGLPPRTPIQAIQAIRNKAATL